MPKQLYFDYPFKDRFCKKCGETKPVEFFSYLNTKSKDGIRVLYKYNCKECINGYNKSTRSVKIKVKFTKEEIKSRQHACQKKRREAFSAEQKLKELQKKRNWYYENREKSIINSKKWKDENKEKLAKTRNEYTDRNRERINKVNRAYVSKRLNSDTLYKLKDSLRRQIRNFIKGKRMSKGGFSTEEILGTSYDLVKIHIESQFKDGMTWYNHGIGNNEWHIDHIIPLASAKNEVELLPLFNYKNLQPLWGLDNRKKAAKMPNIQIAFRI